MSKLTIIVPIHNEKPYLRRCLNSINPPSDVEVILIDDGSTDGSADIVKEYEDLPRHGFRVRTVYHREPWGVALTRQHGVTMATGNFVTFLDADDEYHKNAIARMLKAIEPKDAPDVIQFNHLRVYGNMEPVLRFDNRSGFYTIDKLPDKWQTVWSKVYRREFITENGIHFRGGLQYGEDELFNLECLRACGQLYNSNEVTVVKHFDNPNSLCHTLNTTKLLGLTRALEDLIEEDSPKEFRAALRQIMADHWNSKTYRTFFGEL